MYRPVLISALLFAASPDVFASPPIEEIQVTASKRPALASEFSEALSIVDNDNATPLLTDVLRDAVGVYVQQTTPGQGAPIIRGLKGSAILNLVDGMRLNNAIYRSAPTQYLALVPAVAIETIEVIRGTPTSLYGSDAVGGAVQAITRKPEFLEPGGRGAVELRFDSAELTRSVSGRFEAGNDEISVGLYGGTVSTGNRRTGSGERVGPSGYDAHSFRSFVSISPAEDKSWFIDLQFAEQPETPRVDELVAGFGETEPASSEFAFAPNRRLFAHLQHKRSISDFIWQADLAWQRIDDDRVSRNLGSDNRRFENNRSDLLGATTSVSGLNDRGSWIIGAEFYTDDVSSSRRELDLATGDERLLASRFPDGSGVEQSSIYANTGLSVGERLILNTGARFSNVSIDLAATELTAASSFSVSDLSGDIGLIYMVDDRVDLVANLGAGFRAPNIFDLGTLGERPGNRFNIPNSELDSENVLQADLGIRFHGDQLNLEMMVFALRYDDRITSVLTGDITADGRDIVQSFNTAQSEVYGIEAGFNYSLSDRIILGGVLNYARGEQSTGGGEDEPADRMPPPHGSLQVEYEYSDQTAFEFYAKFASEQDRLSARDVRDNRIDPEGTPGWVILGLSTTMRRGSDWDITIGLHNLLDQRYRFHGSGIDAPGRNLYADFRKNWD